MPSTPVPQYENGFRLREMTSILFEKVADATIASPWFPREAIYIEALQSCGRYVSHSTRVYKLDGILHLVTRLTYLCDPGLPERFPAQNSGFIQSHGLHQFGDYPKLRGGASYVSYSVFNGRQLYSTTPFENIDSEGLYGALTLSIGMELFKFDEIRFPMTKFRCGVESDVDYSPTLPSDCPFSIRAKANFVQPHWFRQSKHGRIVLPGSEVSEFLDLRFIVESFGRQTPSIVLTKVYVELREYIIGSVTLDENHRPNPIPKFLQTITLLEKACRHVLGADISAEDNKISSYIPSALYNCTLPNVGANFFTNEMSRFYAIRTHLYVEWAEHKIRLATSSEISVAETSFHKAQERVPIFVPRMKPPILHSIVRTERFTSPSFGPLVGSVVEVKNLCAQMKLDYLSHQTDGFFYGAEAIAVTKVDAFGDQFFSWRFYFKIQKLLKELQMFRMGYGPVFKDGEPFILCEVFESRKSQREVFSKELIGGQFLRIGQFGRKYEFTHENPTIRRESKMGTSVARQPFKILFTKARPNLLLVCEYKQPYGIIQGPNERIVLPGTKVSDFISLRLVVTVPYEMVENPYHGGNSFNIKSVQVAVIEQLSSYAFDAPAYWDNIETIKKEAVSETYFWSQFRRDESRMSMMVPVNPKVFDCILPRLGPTLYSNAIYREYKIRFHLRIQLGDGGPTRSFVVSQLIKIAARGDEIFTNGRSSLPMYEELLRRK